MNIYPYLHLLRTTSPGNVSFGTGGVDFFRPTRSVTGRWATARSHLSFWDSLLEEGL